MSTGASHVHPGPFTRAVRSLAPIWGLRYSASRLQGPLFQFFTNAFVFFCRMGTVGDVKLKVCIHVDKSFLIVCI